MAPKAAVDLESAHLLLRFGDPSRKVSFAFGFVGALKFAPFFEPPCFVPLTIGGKPVLTFSILLAAPLVLIPDLLFCAPICLSPFIFKRWWFRTSFIYWVLG